jgi:hypothetical protein
VLARRKLEQARFFAEKASSTAGPSDRETFVNFLEAGIVFGRSVTWHLQKEYAHEPGFGDWYEVKQLAMRTDALFRFFQETRTFIIHEGPVTVHKEVSVVLETQVASSASIELKVIRAQPWYKRSSRIIWQDIRREVTQRARRWLKFGRSRRAVQKSSVQVTGGMFFDVPRWKDRPAGALLLEYLAKLEQVVDKAESRFGGRTSQGSAI